MIKECCVREIACLAANLVHYTASMGRIPD